MSSFMCHICNTEVSFRFKRKEQFVPAACANPDCKTKYVCRRMSGGSANPKFVPAMEMYLDTIDDPKKADDIGIALSTIMDNQVNAMQLATALYRRYKRDCQLLGIKAITLPEDHPAMKVKIGTYKVLNEEEIALAIKFVKDKEVQIAEEDNKPQIIVQ